MSEQHQQWDIVTGVGVTALGVALCRAIETRRPDGLASDPFAERFLAASRLPEETLPRPETPTAELGPLWSSMPTYIGVRTRFFDGWFAAAGTAGIRQVVLVAAGLDTRAFRLDWPAGTELYEVDQPLVLRFKDDVLAGERPRCVRHTVQADLRGDWPAALLAAGFDPARPTAWLAEGLLSFLPAETERLLFAHIGKLSAPASRLAVEAAPGNERDRVLQSRFATATARTPFADVATLWQTELRPEPDDVLRADGWTVTTEWIAEAARRYGRPVHGAMSGAADKTMLLTATR
jgi:methyltransferase (TIGR00027 family)